MTQISFEKHGQMRFQAVVGAFFWKIANFGVRQVNDFSIINLKISFCYISHSGAGLERQIESAD